MESFKKELFKKEYCIDFPSYNELNEKECAELRKDIINKFQIKDDDFEKGLEHKQLFFNQVNAEDENFDFVSLLNSLDFKLKSYLFVSWDSFINADKFFSSDFYNYFNDIWFPVSDDIDIVSEDLEWLISIRHDGVIYWCKP